jgi:hypothetical protein
MAISYAWIFWNGTVYITQYPFDYDATIILSDWLRFFFLCRTHCLRLFVAVTILTCPTIEDRTAMLNLWIEVAIESKTALGNMYGFAGLMFGLCMPQV